MFPIIYSDEFLAHHTGDLHPERPERLKAIVEALKTVAWRDKLHWRLPTPVSHRDVLQHVQKVHAPEYINIVRHIAEGGGGLLDLDTPISPRSYDIALLAVSAWLDGIEQVLSINKPAFVLARPPGHHAEGHRGMGFCLFSNAAIAAYSALEQAGVNRVAILDWDVHHGNGTEAIVENNPNIAYCSLHQSPCYPGTGRTSDRGKHNNVLNIPMSPGSNFTNYQRAFEKLVVPFLSDFEPDLLVVSAGYDANHDDPLAEIALHPKDYGAFVEYILPITRRILFGLEGGYHLRALSQSVVATIEKCLHHAEYLASR
jgi:acetoin utilization deacetylase AcuC-like enzyme